MGTPTPDAAARGPQQLLHDIVQRFIAGAADSVLIERMLAGGIAETDCRNIVANLAKDGPTAQARATALALRKREWLLDLMERHRALAPDSENIKRAAGLSGDDFLRQHYAACRPVILTGEMSGWPALSLWTPQYLRQVVGSAVIEYQGERSKSARFEMHKDDHKRELPFDQFMGLITQPSAGNDAYITAYNSARNTAALAPLYADLRPLDKFLLPEPRQGMPWIGPAGTFTPLHHDLTNNLIAQLVGRKHIKMIAAADAGKLANHRHVFSEIADVESPEVLARYPALKEARIYDLTLNPGEIIFIPIGWWHQVRSLDFSVTLTYTNFRWANHWSASYPSG